MVTRVGAMAASLAALSVSLFSCASLDAFFWCPAQCTMATLRGSHRANSARILIVFHSAVSNPLSLEIAPCTWAVAKAHLLSVWMLAIPPFANFRACVRAIKSALWTEVSGSTVEAHMTESKSTTTASAYLVPPWKKPYLSMSFLHMTMGYLPNQAGCSVCGSELWSSHALHSRKGQITWFRAEDGIYFGGSTAEPGSGLVWHLEAIDWVDFLVYF